MAADQNDGVRYLFRGRIADFSRTRAAAAILAFVLGMSVGYTVADFANRSRTDAISARIDRLEMQKFEAQKK
jgi:hypothetical protein